MKRAIIELNLERVFLLDKDEEDSEEPEKLEDVTSQLAELERRHHVLVEEEKTSLALCRDEIERDVAEADQYRNSLLALRHRLYTLVTSARENAFCTELESLYERLDALS
ncbi:MAG: hypothetical protein R6X16_10530, partial [Anaerolineae bacterium]